MATQKEIRKETETELIKKLKAIESFIVNYSDEKGQCKAMDLLFCLEELEKLCRAYGEVLRLSYIVAVQVFKEDKNWYFKALRSNIAKIYNIENIEE